MTEYHECDYGCGKPAVHQFKNGKWCCSQSHSQCLHHKNKTSGSKNSRSKLKESDVINIKETLIKYIGMSNYNEELNKLSIHYQIHPNTILSIMKGHTWKNVGIDIFTININLPLCKCGCGEKVKSIAHQYIYGHNGKDNPGYIWTEDHREAARQRLINVKQSDETIQKRSESLTGRKLSKENKEGISKSKMGSITSPETKRKQRISAINRRKKLHGQLFPGYNQQGCKLIDKMGKRLGLNFQHAENGGEYHIKELGYWVDGYDKDYNVVIEVDEPAHYDSDGNLSERDVRRQQEIEEYLGCEFIRVRI